MRKFVVEYRKFYAVEASSQIQTLDDAVSYADMLSPTRIEEWVREVVDGNIVQSTFKRIK